MRNFLVLLLALLIGLLIAYIDSRPNWDDAGVTAFAILLSCGLLGAIHPERPAAWALAVGGWIPFLAIVRHQGYASLIALAFAFAGAYAGMFFARLLMPTHRASEAARGTASLEL